MTPQHETIPDQPAWNPGELSPESDQYVRDMLAEVRDLRAAYGVLGNELEGLPPGSSVAVYCLPSGNQSPGEGVAVMLNSARKAAEAIQYDRLNLDPMRTPFTVRRDERPEDFTTATLPKRALSRMTPDDSIGYIRMEVMGSGEKAASVGALDPKTQKHYSVSWINI